MFERIKRMLIKEFIQVLRDPRMKQMVLVMPVIQLLLFGYAVNTDVKNADMAVYDLDNSPQSRTLVSRFSESGYFRVAEIAQSPRDVAYLMNMSAVRAVIEIPKGFSADLAAGRTAMLQFIVDGTDSNTARILFDYGSRIVARYSEEIIVERLLSRNGVRMEPRRVEASTRAWFNENLESRNFFIPGVIAILLTLITLMLTSMAIVREKEAGTIEQIMVTPISPFEFILGKTAPFAAIALFDAIVVTVVGVTWFEVPIRGSLLLLLFAAVLYLMTTLGIGLFISTVSRTQQQAMMSTFFFYFPAMLLSGFMFPIANMPKPVQILTIVNPLRYILVILRGIFLKGVGVDILWQEFLALAVLGSLTLFLAVRRFHKTLA